MGELISLRRARKAAQRAAAEKTAAANRAAHGAPKHLRKAAKAEKQRVVQDVEAHRLDREKTPD